jgi:hypothetical protein
MPFDSVDVFSVCSKAYPAIRARRAKGSREKREIETAGKMKKAGFVPTRQIKSREFRVFPGSGLLGFGIHPRVFTWIPGGKHNG